MSVGHFTVAKPSEKLIQDDDIDWGTPALILCCIGDSPFVTSTLLFLSVVFRVPRARGS
jgi:hypothetical protein